MKHNATSFDKDRRPLSIDEFRSSLGELYSALADISQSSDLVNRWINIYQELKDDKAYNVGSTVRPYLGFDECALPVVLSHNTPNNSLPILWQDADDDKQFKGLFPRISRH